MEMKTKIKAAIFFAVLLFFCGVVATRGPVHAPTVSYTQFLDEVRSGRISNVIITPNNSGSVRATSRWKQDRTVETVLPADYRDALEAMLEENVDVEIQPRPAGWANAAPFLTLAGSWVVLLFLLRGRHFPLRR